MTLRICDRGEDFWRWKYGAVSICGVNCGSVDMSTSVSAVVIVSPFIVVVCSGERDKYTNTLAN